MVCRIADNPALEALRAHVQAEKHCHSQRIDCIHRLPRAEEPSYYGVSGAFMGYCQALFHKQGSLGENTQRISDILSEAGLPWARSHELFLGHRGSETITEFVEGAAAPLMDLGRVPILITGLDVADQAAVSEILEASINVVDGETVLVRMLVNSKESMRAFASLIRELVAEAEASGKMPQWWPLAQASDMADDWRDLKDDLGPLWRYANVAINPFTDAATFAVVAEQVMVAQFVVPGNEDIDASGAVRISADMHIYGAQSGDVYSIPEFAERISALDSWPTCIFLGPTLPSWRDAENVERVSKAVSAFMARVRDQWERDGMERYEPLWRMAA
jgi:hypothetical protein